MIIRWYSSCHNVLNITFLLMLSSIPSWLFGCDHWWSYHLTFSQNSLLSCDQLSFVCYCLGVPILRFLYSMKRSQFSSFKCDTCTIINDTLGNNNIKKFVNHMCFWMLRFPFWFLVPFANDDMKLQLECASVSGRKMRESKGASTLPCCFHICFH